MIPGKFDLSRLVGHFIICPALGLCKCLYEGDIDCQVGKVSKVVNTMWIMHLHIPTESRISTQLLPFSHVLRDRMTLHTRVCRCLTMASCQTDFWCPFLLLQYL